jgi:hypothetical protein
MTLLSSTFVVAGLALPALALADDPNLTPVQTPAPKAELATAAPAGTPGVDEDGLDIRIDFGTARGFTLPGEWNNIDNFAGVTFDLIDFNTGTSTGASIDGLGGAWRSFVGDDGPTFPEQDWYVHPASGDAAGLSSDLAASYLISGLPEGEYTVEVIAARTTFDYLNTFTIDGALANRTFLGTPVVTPWGAASDGLANGNWLIWDGVVADGGAIQLDLQAGPGTLGILNAMRISMTGGGCRVDLDGDGVLTLFDFLAFQNAFDAGDLIADFDGDGVLTLFDFLAFQNEFDAGCE